MSDMEKGAKGVISVVLEELEFKTGRTGKRYANLKLERGGVVFRASCFTAAAVEMLEACSEGEEISVFGAVESRSVNDKVYTDFRTLKVYAEPKNDTGIFVTGVVLASGATKYEKWVDVDTTENPDYPSFVRVAYSKDSSQEFEVGETVIDLRIAAKGKFGVWTMLETKAKPAAKSPSKKAADKPAAKPVDAPPVEGDDIPWEE